MNDPPWVVVVPQKDLTKAKSRLRLPSGLRQQVAAAMLQDSVQAMLSTQGVRRVVVIVETPEDAALLAHPSVDVLQSPGIGLNDAIEVGAAHVQRRWPEAHVAAMPSDLFALRSEQLAVALRTGTQHPRTFVADRHRVGTTLLTARAGRRIDPHFGQSSRADHLASGAWENHDDQLGSLRHDVDRLGDLAELANRDSPHCPGPQLQAALKPLLSQILPLVSPFLEETA